MTDDWPQIKTRLEVAAGTSSGHFDPKLPAYIRAALQRVDEATIVATQEHDRAEALRQRVGELERYNIEHTKLMYTAQQRAEAAEAKLARVVEVGDQIVARNCGDSEVALWAAAKGE